MSVVLVTGKEKVNRKGKEKGRGWKRE